jgi:hypothetical protein
MELWYVFILVGLVCGVFSALFGVGAGIIMIPVLSLAFHYPQKSAQGMSLAVMAPMALMGAIRYKMNSDIDINMLQVVLLAIGGVAGAWLGVHIVERVPGAMLRRMFAVILVVAAVQMFRSAARAEGKPARTAAATTPERPPAGTHEDPN